MKGKSRLALGSSILLLVALGGLYFALKVWMPFMWALLGPGLMGLGVWIYLERKSLAEFFLMKSTKQGLNMGALILIVLAFLAIINYLGGKYYKTYDLSIERLNTLSDQTQKILMTLDAPLIVKFFYKNGVEKVEDNKKIFREVIKRYQDKTDKVQFEFVEMNENAQLSKDFAATRGAGEAFVEYKGNRNRIEKSAEQEITNAIIKVTRTTKKTVYFVEGHKERNTEKENDETSASSFKQMLEKNSYITKSLSLVNNPEIPSDADAVVILGPQQNFLPLEIKAIESYLQKGGALLLALDDRSVGGLHSLLSTVGLQLENFFVFNVYNTPTGQVVSADTPTVAVNYSPTNEITKVFGLNQMTVFRQPQALTITKPSDTIKTEVLVKTPENSVALKELNSADYIGQPQSYTLAVNVTGKWNGGEKDFNMIVFSDVDFLSNILLYQNLNRDLALNSIAALVKESDLISVSTKETGATKLLVSPPEFNQFFKFVVAGIFFPIPIFLMIVSLVLWMRRRHA